MPFHAPSELVACRAAHACRAPTCRFAGAHQPTPGVPSPLEIRQVNHGRSRGDPRLLADRSTLALVVSRLRGDLCCASIESPGVGGSVGFAWREPRSAPGANAVCRPTGLQSPALALPHESIRAPLPPRLRGPSHRG
jgi:hypothetical protein